MSLNGVQRGVGVGQRGVGVGQSYLKGRMLRVLPGEKIVPNT